MGNFTHSKPGHQRCADLVFVIGGCDWIYAGGNYTLDIIVRKAKGCREALKERLCRVAIAFLLMRNYPIQLVDDKDEIGLPRHGESLHDTFLFCICVDAAISGQLFRVIDGPISRQVRLKLQCRGYP